MRLTKVKPLDISKVLGKAKARVHQIGVELEGGWTSLPEPGCTIIRDGSVHVNPPAGATQFHMGELPLPPLQRDAVSKWIKKYYPHVVNESCGMHVHMSFKSAFHYQLLMAPEFSATIIHYFNQWARGEQLAGTHPIWPRLMDKSRYCQHIFDADMQARATRKGYDQGTPGHRYSVMNYCHTYNNGTMECRLLPMMEDHERATRAVLHLIDITDAYLAVTHAQEERLGAFVALDADTEGIIDHQELRL